MIRLTKNIYKPIGYLATGAFFLFGRYIISRIVSKRWGKKLYWPLTQHYYHIQSTSGNIWDAGFDGPEDGPSLVFIHGLNADHTQWYYQRRYFNKKYRLIFLDMPIHNRSFSAYKLAIPTLADDIKYVLDQLGIKNAIIYGHSMGGTILVQYCLQHRGDINTKAVIMHGGSYINPILTSRFAVPLKYIQKPVLIPFLNFVKKYERFIEILTHVNFWNGISCLFFRYLYFSGNQTALQLVYISAMAPRSNSGAVAESLLQLMQFNATDELEKIQVPVLIIGGVKDRLNTAECSKYMHQHIKTSKLKIVAEGHQSMVENHPEINGTVDEFINQVLKS